MAETKRKKTKNLEVVNIPLAELHPFPNQPFAVRDDESMQETAASIKEYGVLTPAVARPLESGGYELISGHRRKRACELAGLAEMPVIVKEMDADTATIMMVDSNLQRENILPSEKAKAYKMKLEAIKRQGARTDLTSTQVAQKLSVEQVGDDAGISKDQVRRYIRLTELEPELQQMVDEKKIAFTPAVELSYLQPEEQKQLLQAIDSEQATPSLSQAQRMKKMSQAGELDEDKILAIMQEEKKPEQVVKRDANSVSFSTDRLRKYFPRSYTTLQMENTIIKLLEAWQKKRQMAQER